MASPYVKDSEGNFCSLFLCDSLLKFDKNQLQNNSLVFKELKYEVLLAGDERIHQYLLLCPAKIDPASNIFIKICI